MCSTVTPRRGPFDKLYVHDSIGLGLSTLHGWAVHGTNIDNDACDSSSTPSDMQRLLPCL